jgi:L-amino acid N-acyltransferase YncA
VLGTLRLVTVTIRRAEPGDSDAIAEIHNQGIVDRLATLDTTLRTAPGVRQWLAERENRHPVIVATIDDGRGAGVIGWASLNRFNPRAAYDHVADFSVYVDRRWRGQRIGSQLLEQLIALAREIGFHKLVLSALARNAAGVRLYSKLGFERVGIYREMGMLDGEWVDVILMEKIL